MTMARPGFFRQVKETAEMIKISHSVFALPFALASAALAFRAGEEPWSWGKAGWIVFCAVMSRTAAMAQNRLVDTILDAGNPRTKERALPAGRVSRNFVLDLVLFSGGLFVFGAGQLNELCLKLSPVVLVVLLGYPYAKRFTALCHLWLGTSLGLAPVGAWVAIRGSFEDFETPLALGLGVLFWTAGFDVIYACQDYDVDREQRLRSIPARFGVARALRLSSLMHAACIGALASLIWSNPYLGWPYACGLFVALVLLVYEHSIVKADDLSRVNLAFFTLNGLVSLVVGGAAVWDALS